MVNVIILQLDALLHLHEQPADGVDHPQAAALVHIRIEPLDPAGPVDLLFDHRTGGVDHLEQSVGGSTKQSGGGSVHDW